MTAKTHVLGSMSLALGGYILMDKGGLLIPDVEPLIQLGIILPSPRGTKGFTTDILMLDVPEQMLDFEDSESYQERMADLGISV